jgi:hypothetical protein
VAEGGGGRGGGAAAGTAAEDPFVRFCEQALAVDGSVMFCAVTDKFGGVLALNSGRMPLFDRKAFEQYAVQMTVSVMVLEQFDGGSGKLNYAVAFNDNVARVIVPVLTGDLRFFVMLFLNPRANVPLVVESKILPLIKNLIF